MDVVMRAFVSTVGAQPAEFVGRQWVSCFFSALLIMLSCTCAFGQDLIEKRHSDVTRPVGAFGQPLVTANALRAPEKARKAVEKATAALINHRPEEAGRQLSRALELYPNYAQALTLRAIWKMPTDPSDSISDLQHAIQVDPQYGLAYAVLAAIYNDSGRYDDASPVILRASQLLPAAWQVHYEMARTRFGQHRGSEALREITEARRGMSADTGVSSGSCASVHYLRGVILMNQHELAEARLEFEQTVKEEPAGTLAKTSHQLIAQLESDGIR
jgi:tetratricopeptide (TPR) repeat protein